MTDEVERDSFAARAAAWVPPWAREPEPEPEPEVEPAEPVAELTEPETDVEPAAEPEAAPDLTAEPETDFEPVAEPQAAVPEPGAGPAPEAEAAAPEAGPETEAIPEPAAVEIEADEPVEPEPAPEAEPETVVPQGLFEVDPGTPGSAEPVGESAAPIAPAGPADLAAALEAILMVVDEPVTEQTLAQVLEQPLERIGAELQRLAAEYGAQGRGFELRRAAGGWRFYTHPDQAAYVERFVLDGQSIRLTQAALETLAVVAYKQPVTRSRMSAIRGVNCDGVVRTLVTRGLIEECGTEPETGAHLYRTSTLFLEKLGLDSVEQLPPLAPFLPDDVDAVIDAQR
jgi:segregation and condensation protein B